MLRIIFWLWALITSLSIVIIGGVFTEINERVDQTETDPEKRATWALLEQNGITPKHVLIALCAIPIVHIYTLYYLIMAMFRALIKTIKGYCDERHKKTS